MSVIDDFLFRVPEWSVLGHLLFVMYLFPNSDFVRKHNVSMLSFADNTHKDPSSMIVSVQATRRLRNRGVSLDVYLTMNAQIIRVCQVSNFQLKTIRNIQNVPSGEARG